MSPIVRALQPLPPCSWIVVEPIVRVPPPQSIGSSSDDRSAVERRAGGDDLERRARFVGVRERAAAAGLRGRVAEPVRVEAGHDARARIAPVDGFEDDRGRARGPELGREALELALGRVLDRRAAA